MSRGTDPLLERITADPGILGGKPIVRGTRIPVELILKRLSDDLDQTTIFESYPRLTPDDIRACLRFAGVLLEGERYFPGSSELTATAAR